MNEQGHENVRTAVVSMLRSCADYLANLPPGDVDAFIRGEVELRLTLSAKKRPTKKKQRVALDSNLILQVITQLQSMGSRHEGERLLKENASTKSALELLARKLDLAVRKGENVDDLMRRIIEATIGYRLASAAIQGKSSSRERESGNAVDTPDPARNNAGVKE